MTETPAGFAAGHGHIFLGQAHDRNERRAWFVIVYYGLTEGRAAWKHAPADVPARLF